MNENLKALTERIARDQKRFSEQRNPEGVYVCELACGWVEKYLTDASELARRRDALGRILNHPDFQSALRQSREILPVDAESVGKCETVAALLTRFAESDVYLETLRWRDIVSWINSSSPQPLKPTCLWYTAIS